MVVLLAVVHPAVAENLFPGLLRAALPVVVALPSGASVRLEGLVIRPDRPGRFPLVVMIHGTPRATPGQAGSPLARVSPASFNTAAIAFAERGYAAVAVLRRGYGGSEGPFAEIFARGSTCDTRDYLPVARVSAEDVIGAVAALRREAWVDPDRVLLLGVSTGGVAVTAAAALTPPGVVGVVSFAGGRGSTAADTVCNPDGLVRMFGALGGQVRIPAQWIYAENDHFFAPDLARRMHAAYTAGGAPARFAMLPPFGADGHTLLSSGPVDVWWPAMEGFLAASGLPTRILVALPPLTPLAAPARLSEACRAGFAAFNGARIETKAFAVTPTGGCGWVLRAATQADAGADALTACMARGAVCRLHAVGHRLVID